MSRITTHTRAVPERRATITPGASLTTALPAQVDRGAIEETIRVRAFEIYQSRVRDGQQGNAELDWLRAEREVGLATDRDASTAL